MYGAKVDGKDDEREHSAKDRAGYQSGQCIALVDA